MSHGLPQKPTLPSQAAQGGRQPQGAYSWQQPQPVSPQHRGQQPGVTSPKSAMGGYLSVLQPQAPPHQHGGSRSPSPRPAPISVPPVRASSPAPVSSASFPAGGHSRQNSGDYNRSAGYGAGGAPTSPSLPLPKASGQPKGQEDAGPYGVRFGEATYQDFQDDSYLTQKELEDAFAKMDSNGNGSLSKLELIAAVTRDREIADMLGMDGESLLSDETSFDALHQIYEEMSAGKKGVDFVAFSKFVRKATTVKTPKTSKMQEMFNLIDVDGNGYISKLELVAAMQGNKDVDEFLTPGVDSRSVMDDESMFDRVDALFESIAAGKKRIGFADFERYYRKAVTAAMPRAPSSSRRAATRLFIIGPGFGNQINPRQSHMIEAAGYQIRWCFNIPNPEVPNFPVEPYLDQIKSEMDAFKPDIIAAASKGGVYLVGLWARGYWKGPTLMLNAHPMMTRLPKDVQLVVASGSNDEVYPNTRTELENLMATGQPNKAFLYYTANSGQLQSGQLSRVGDYHNMESILNHDCLPRLIDATLCPAGPEVHFVSTWGERLSEERRRAELWLGYSPESVMRLWETCGKEPRDHLIDVKPHTEEYRHVCEAFKAMPIETQAYILSPPEVWAKVRPLRVQRIENSLQGEASWKPYYKSVCRSLEDQGVEFEPGTHTSWAFHGCDANALESIINNPVAGFQPLASGTRSATLWGSGTYFAREAKYVADGGFCGQPAPDGTRRLLMCLLITGMPCLGSPDHKGVLPFRNKPHRYNCSVDCLASPEVFIVQHTGAAIPCYMITFA
eukprot:TRINITY_DN80267_c0_g1_i1.p1 TRINITY_DN80267_c0_g1~~TRINITY_DN80267_c0_g1_i1.p1  ORF type:complete len:787 (+),score=126.05 TRINITY_DN80267_c0_g1_i1:89-2449(+)